MARGEDRYGHNPHGVVPDVGQEDVPMLPGGAHSSAYHQ
jgi:hypothetical protein